MLIRTIAAIAACLALNANAQESYVVGTWNLEHLRDGAKRGFPEMSGQIPTRKASDYQFIASIVKDLSIRILLLQEINGKKVPVTDAEDDLQEAVRSTELEKLIAKLGPDYAYVIGASGNKQHIAILYDKRFAQLNSACETDFPNVEVQGASLFDRQPFFANFTFLKDGQPKNDLVVVGVHLASGQGNNKNHDMAMESLVKRLEDARVEEFCIPSDEFDILIAGDFNANRFKNPVEQFWNKMEADGWDVLADDGDDYSATRMSGTPLALADSKIDYVIVSRGLSQGSGNPGLGGEEVLDAIATVHKELVQDTLAFRKKASDHLPVTINVRVMGDTD